MATDGNPRQAPSSTLTSTIKVLAAVGAAPFVWLAWSAVSAMLLGWGLALNVLVFSVALALVVPASRAALWKALRRPEPTRAPWLVVVPLAVLSTTGGVWSAGSIAEDRQLAAAKERGRAARVARAKVLLKSARSAFHAGNWDAAVEAFSSAVELKPLSSSDRWAFATALRTRGNALVKAGNLTEGVAALDAAAAQARDLDGLADALASAKKRLAAQQAAQAQEETKKLYALDVKPKAPRRTHPTNLARGSKYRVSRETPLMPHHSPGNPLVAIAQMKKIPVRGTIYIRATHDKRGTLWYEVAATDANGAKLGRGWINSTALLGQSIERAD